MANYKETARGILEHVGGSENISGMTHCATRLRLNLKDISKADDEAVKSVDGVVNVIKGAGQYQILIGIEVPHVYDEFENLVKGENSNALDDSPKTEGSVLSKIFFSNIRNFLTTFTCVSRIRYSPRSINFICSTWDNF